jgi:hypothetical protein
MAAGMTSDVRAKEDIAKQSYASGYVQAQQDLERGLGRMTTERAYGSPQNEGGIERQPSGGSEEGDGDKTNETDKDYAAQLAKAQGGLQPYVFRYKKETGFPTNLRAGIMAQDALKHPISAAMVRMDPETGMLGIDYGAGLSYALAAEALNDKRLRKLESKNARGK